MRHLSWLASIGKYIYKSNTGRALSILVLLWIMAVIAMPKYEGWTVITTTWWFLVSLTTVGYGDMFPTTLTGKLFAVPVLLVGIGIGAFILGNLANTLFNLRRTRMKGLADYSSYKEHIVIMGWRDDLTLEIIRQILSGHSKKKIVLCSEHLEERPEELPSNVVFVRGHIASDDVIYRSGIKSADKVIVIGRNDQEAIMATIAVMTADDGDKAHITVKVDRPDNARHLERLSAYHGDISIIKSLEANLITQEMEDKGIGEIMATLLDNNGQATPHRIDLAKPRKWNEVKVKEFLTDDMLPFACITEDGKKLINPKGNPTVTAIFVIAEKPPIKGVL